jgi:hypothetical protein
MAELYHYGVGHKDGGHSGRYPWGSGKRVYQRTSKETIHEKPLSRHQIRKQQKDDSLKRQSERDKKIQSSGSIKDVAIGLAETALLDKESRAKIHDDIDSGKSPVSTYLKEIGKEHLTTVAVVSAAAIGTTAVAFYLNKYGGEKAWKMYNAVGALKPYAIKTLHVARTAGTVYTAGRVAKYGYNTYKARKQKR